MSWWAESGANLRKWLSHRFEQDSPIRRIGWALVFAISLSSILSASLVPDRVDLKVDQVAPRDIEAPKDMVNRVETNRLRQEAAEEVNEVYDVDKQVLGNAETELKAVFSEIDRLQAVDSEEMTPSAKIEALRDVRGLEELPDQALAMVLNASDEELAALEKEAVGVLRLVMSVPIQQESLETARKLAESEIEGKDLDRNYRLFLKSLVLARIRPNAVFNEEETVRRRQEAMSAVEPVIIRKGEIIVEKGSRVTPEDIEILKDAGLLESRSNYITIVGSVLLSLMIVSLSAVYFYFFQFKFFRSERFLVVAGIITTIILLLSKALVGISPYLPPVAGATILVTILIGPQVALIIGLLIVVVLGFLSSQAPQLILVGIAGGIAGIVAVNGVGQRAELMRAGFIVGAVEAAGVLIVSLVSGSLSNSSLLVNMMWAVVNGVASAVIAIGSLPFFESFFGIITSVKLLELSNPNQPLLRKLMMEAPGTYHHSIIVANLAEAATEAIGGDPMLARVGAFYHDIGKIKRPYFFVDNQLRGENPHDKMSPSLSTLIITSHVKDGVEMAREEKLPGPVIDIIRQHHGTTLVSYFYWRATETNKVEHFVEQDFRYEGPRPQTKEAAIVMLADSSESAVRSLSDPNPGRIEGMVRKIIKDRLNDGQLDECDLTLKDLDTAARVFARALSGVFHPRIEYPIPGLKEGRGKEQPKGGTKEDGDNNDGQPGPEDQKDPS